MIHYHGVPITPDTCAIEVIKSRHAFVSFAHPAQISLVAEYCQSFAIDNGAFVFWRHEKSAKWGKFYAWLENWINHPRLDFVVIPDVIEGSEEENDDLLSSWPFGNFKGAPVWHTNESFERLKRLSYQYPRVCIGSSGVYDVSNVDAYVNHVSNALNYIRDNKGYLITKIHLLRGLNPKVFTKLPASSGDSTTVGRNIGIDSRWKGTYQPKSKITRARILTERIEYFNSLSKLPVIFDL